MSVDVVTMAYGKTDDPDAQATITDYLDYTEYLPADLQRALKLIGNLDEEYQERVNKVHELSKTYGDRPRDSTPSADAHDLRAELSYNLELAIKAREASCGEAERMQEMIIRYRHRLTGIQTKLLALPKPPSRDPSPAPRSPPVARKTPLRLHLRHDSGRNTEPAGRMREKGRKKAQKSRRVTVPGEVLPPLDPGSPQDFTDSDWESIPPSPLPMPTSRVGGSRSRPPKSEPPRPVKRLKITTDRLAPFPRQPGMGTNVHSQVAGISTSNALSLLPKPPPDAINGSEHAPWMRLTEYEMALLRKRMKKNAIWTPSETMIRRELAAAGRGPDAYRKRKAECEGGDESFRDDDNIAMNSPNKPLVPGEIRADPVGIATESLVNRGMKLNEAKKQKREMQLERTRQETREAQRNLDSLGPVFKDLFKKPGTFESPLTPSLPHFNGNLSSETPLEKKSKSERSTHHKKNKTGTAVNALPRERNTRAIRTVDKVAGGAEGTEGHGDSSVVPVLEHPPKRQKPDSTAKTTTRLVPLASPGPSTPGRERHQLKAKPSQGTIDAKSARTSTLSPKSNASSSRGRRISLTLRGPASPATDNASVYVTSRRQARRNSTETSSPRETREKTRRASAIVTAPATPSAPMTPGSALTFTAASRRAKRAVADNIAQDEEQSGAIPASTRDRSSRSDRRHSATGVPSSQRKQPMPKNRPNPNSGRTALEALNPDEPRYCICGDISWGEMVECENKNVSRPKLATAIVPCVWQLTICAVQRRMVSLQLRRIDGSPTATSEMVLPAMQGQIEALNRELRTCIFVRTSADAIACQIGIDHSTTADTDSEAIGALFLPACRFGPYSVLIQNFYSCVRDDK